MIRRLPPAINSLLAVFDEFHHNIQQCFENQSGEQMHQTNSLSPNRMTSDQRRVEIAALLAKAIIRLKAPDKDSQILVDKTAQRSVHGTTPDDHQQENI